MRCVFMVLTNDRAGMCKIYIAGKIDFNSQNCLLHRSLGLKPFIYFQHTKCEMNQISENIFAHFCHICLLEKIVRLLDAFSL
jgi:hypothetical protein